MLVNFYKTSSNYTGDILNKEISRMLFKTIELNPTDSIAHNYKGMALSDLKRYEEAIELNPNNTFAINYRNIAIKKIKK